MINDKNKFIFIHIPKTGGISLFHFLKINGLANNQNFSKHVENRISNETINNFQDYFKFAFHRNPWDRIVSLWKYWTVKRHPKAIVSDTILKSCPEAQSLKGFCFNIKNIFCDILPPRNYIYTLNQVDLNGQSDYLKIDFWGRFEYLNEDFKIICDKLNIKHNNLPKINTTQHRCYREYYDSNLVKYVAKMYEKDIDTFKYVF